ncbi:MAG: tetratricopeptide repeat protein [Nannocystaceae bacterium]|nr:tetratricopeptide repeat protein [bacterium]
MNEVADVTLPARVEAGWAPVHVHGRAPALYRIPITLSLVGLFMIAIQAGQPLVGFASMMAVLATAAALSLRSMARRYAPAAVLRDQGDAKLAAGRYKEARAFYERALVMVQRELPATSPEVLSGNYNLAVVSSMLGDHDQASTCLEALLAGLGGRVPNAWSGRVAWLLRRIARHHSLHGRHRAAIRACRLAIELVGEAPGADDCTVRSLLNDLAWASLRSGDLGASERAFRDALAVHEQYREIAAALATPTSIGDETVSSPYRAPSPTETTTSGGLDRAVAHSLVGLGWTLFELGRFGDADASFGRAVMLASASAGGEDASLRAEALRGRGTVALETGREAEAERQYRRASEAPLPADAPQGVALLLDRAWLACGLGEDPRAEGLLVEAERRLRGAGQQLGAQPSLTGAWHAVWAELSRRQCNYRDAHKHVQRAVVLAGEVLAEHPRRASVLALASRVHTARSELAAAERYARRAMQLLRGRSLPDTHARYAEVQVALGELHVARGQFGAAEQAFRSALEIREGIVGPEHRSLDEILEGLCGVYEATGRLDDAANMQRRREGIRHAA